MFFTTLLHAFYIFHLIIIVLSSKKRAIIYTFSTQFADYLHVFYTISVFFVFSYDDIRTSFAAFYRIFALIHTDDSHEELSFC